MGSKGETTFHGLLGQNKKHRSMTGLRQMVESQRASSRGKTSQDQTHLPQPQKPGQGSAIVHKKTESTNDGKFASKRKFLSTRIEIQNPKLFYSEFSGRGKRKIGVRLQVEGKFTLIPAYEANPELAPKLEPE